MESETATSPHALCFVCGKGIERRDRAFVVDRRQGLGEWNAGIAVHNGACLTRLQPELDAMLDMLQRQFSREK